MDYLDDLMGVKGTFLYVIVVPLVTLTLTGPGKAAGCGPADIQKYLQGLEEYDEAILEQAAECGALTIPAFSGALKNHTSENVRTNSAYVLTSLAQSGELERADFSSVLAALVDALEDDSVAVQSAAATSLGDIGQAAEPVVPLLLSKLPGLETGVRADVLIALGTIRGEPELVIPELIGYLDSSENTLQSASAISLGRFRTAARLAVPNLLRLTEDDQDFVRREATRALGEIAEGVLDEAETPEQVTDAIATVSEIEAALLNSPYPEVQEASQPVFRTAEALGLKRYELRFLRVKHWVLATRRFWIFHPIFWLALIFIYPRSRTVQSIFFWNKYVRDVFGLWYISLAITYIPFLRKQLFEPFKAPFLADAKLDTFDASSYFPDIGVQKAGLDPIEPIGKAISRIKGQIVLEGDSGLGKSCFLKHLARTSKQITVYLPAQRCRQGVMEAIQAKLHGPSQDAEFLRKLIYSGAVTILIDGLNEVSAETRAKVTEFAESFSKSNILMTTQPMDWAPPNSAQLYRVRPLTPDQIQAFLLSRGQSLRQIAAGRGLDYETVCRNYLQKDLKTQLPTQEEWDMGQQILSNPMDLTTVAAMLAAGQLPDLFHLQEQQYVLMAEEYKTQWKQAFPLKKFSEAVYQLYLNDEKALPADGFLRELNLLSDEKYRMLVSRQWLDPTGEAKQEWYFRHDRIADFFLVQVFLGESDEAQQRLLKHLGDSRFRGVYFLLANLLPLEAAQQLREDLIHYAADTQDHTVSDTYVQQLRARHQKNSLKC